MATVDWIRLGDGFQREVEDREHGKNKMSAADLILRQPQNLRTPATLAYSRALVDEKEIPAKIPAPYPSRFPLCSLLVLDDLLPNAKQTSTFLSDAYTNMGTGLHNAMHLWLGARNSSKQRLLGNWTCKECGEFREFSTISVCPTCETACVYGELKVSWKGVRGYLDCVVLDEANRISIIDYKTTTDYGVNHKGVEGYRLAYVYQLFAYAFLFFKTFGRQLKAKPGAASLLFVSRNNPHKFKEYSWGMKFARDAGKQVVLEQLESWNAALASKKQGNPKAAWKERLCESPTWYEKNIENIKSGGCPLAGKCVYSDKSAMFSYFKKRFSQ